MKCELLSDVVRITVPLPLDSPDHINCYLITTADEVVLVDTGMGEGAAAIRDFLTALGLPPDRVVLTHGHLDHWGGAAEFGDRVWAHPDVLPSLLFFEQGVAALGDHPTDLPQASEFERAFEGFRDLVGPVPALEPLSDGELIGDWQIHWTPGHDPGHVCLFRPQDRFLICGDLLLPGFTPNIQPGMDGRDALEDFFSSLESVASLRPSLVFPAHGEPYADGQGRAMELRRHHKRRLAMILEAIGEEPRTVGELSSHLFDELAGSEDRMLAELETFAHLEYLRRRNLAAKVARGRWTTLAEADRGSASEVQTPDASAMTRRRGA